MRLALAALAFLAAVLGLAFQVEPVPSWFFQLAWWPYILAADELNYRLSGSSLLRTRKREFWLLALGSVAWWTFFELINLRLGNWYYVMSPPEPHMRSLGGLTGFATVLPGIIETLEIFENKGWLRSVRVAPLSFSRMKELFVLALGVASFGLPLRWPALFYPLTWGAVVFLIEPWNRRHARRSFLRDLEQGEAGPFCRTLLAGTVCGLLWESWNYWARTKWVYTVPPFEELRIFEMPFLGFLGFAPFAVESLVVMRFCSAWGERLLGRGRFGARLALVVATLLLALPVFDLADEVTVDSFYTPLAEVAIVDPRVRQALVASGAHTPEQGLRLLRSGDTSLARRAGVTPRDLDEAARRLGLVLHHQMGADRAAQLGELGIHGVSDFDGWTPDTLTEALRARGAITLRDRFLDRRVRVWFRGR
jgi:hypothetical protein